MAGEKYLIWTIWVWGSQRRLLKGTKQDRPRHGVDDYRNGDAFPEIQNTEALDFNIQSSLGRLFFPASPFATRRSSARKDYEQSILFSFGNTQ
jgi:hypothetical protein